MGGGMALLFAEDGVHVNLSDPSEDAMDVVIEKAEKAGYNGMVKKHKGRDYFQLQPILNRRSCTTKSTTRSASRFRNHASLYSLCHMAVLVTRSLKA